MGQFHYLRMGQGLAGAPQTYTRLKEVFSGPIPEPNPELALSNTDIPGEFHYFMDDDFGAHRTYTDQWQFLDQHYLPRMAWGRMTMRPKKTGFFLDRINPLGFVLKGEGLRPSEDKVLKRAAVMESVDEWHQRDPGRRDKNGRLYRSPRRVERWEWGEAQEESFLAIKRAVMENAVFGGDEEILLAMTGS